jgi:hypothetical protein
MSPARWLGLAAAPTFAVMAAVTGVQEAQAGAMVCGPMPGGAPLSGMVVMYLLMSAFHLGPWLKLGAERPASSH